MSSRFSLAIWAISPAMVWAFSRSVSSISSPPAAGTGGAAFCRGLARAQGADQLGHGAHGAEHAPGPGLEEHHDDEADEGGGEHDGVEPEGELGHPGDKEGAMIGPVPGHLEGPEQLDEFSDVTGPRPHQIGGEEHLKEHHKEKDEKPVPERLCTHPPGGGFVAGQPEPPAQQ